MKNKNSSFKELLILRHGKSDWTTDNSDFERPLKDRGKRGAQKIGSWLAEKNLRPEIVIASPAERALTTAEKASKAMGDNTSIIQVNDALYGADRDDLLNIISDISEKIERVLIVGHNPGLEDLLVYLAKEYPHPSDGKLLPTATLAYFKIRSPWNCLKQKSSTLHSITRARDLPKKFPFNTLDGVEYRARPKYYYSQSAMIPYRIVKNKIEVLLVRSSSGKHWIVPKGIIEPGLSAVKSAEKEAFEEAGITGKADKKLLGSYTYEKWKAQCTIDVFAMSVNRVLPESEWQESHRKRQWVSLESAQTMLKQTELIPLLKKLQQRIESCLD